MTITGSKANWLVGLGVLSLCLNLFLVGMMAGGRMHAFGPHGPGGWRGPFGPDMMAGLEGVPPDVKDLVKQKFETDKPKFDAARSAIKAAKEKLAAAAAADPYDQAAMDAAFEEMRQAMQNMAQTAHQTISEILPQIPANVRKDWVEQWGKRGGGNPGG